MWSIALAAALGVAHAGAAPAQPASEHPALSPAIAAEYVRPHERVEIEPGRKLNLFCMGSGKTTVLFDAGGSDWSVIWALVQPAVARQARACTYDRGGLGYSDASRWPRSPVAIVEDLHLLVAAAKLDRPLVFVGHSLGGFNMKLYAALHLRMLPASCWSIPPRNAPANARAPCFRRSMARR